MTVQIVTDSLSDLTQEHIKDHGITVVPLTVIFGHETYLDRVTITTNEFYRRLVHGDIWRKRLTKLSR
jgi:fatty acid-binding protein DegV